VSARLIQLIPYIIFLLIIGLSKSGIIIGKEYSGKTAIYTKAYIQEMAEKLLHV